MRNTIDQKTALDKVEQCARIVGLGAIPVLLAVIGSIIQNKLSSENLARDYVQIAVSILKEPRRDGDERLRAWAAVLLNVNSPNAKLDSKAIDDLTSGKATIPVTSYDYTSPVGSSLHLTSKSK